ncbi:t1pks [Neopestalotiopsis sp. 37M]|nr:t1pks [Neopestalotiopsis sp. 37M]
MRFDEETSVASIAVVGVSCRLPGGANSPEKLWNFLREGGEAWSPVPVERFNETSFYHPSADDPNGTSHHRGGHFIDGDVRDFDHSFFRMSPQQAMAMDPQQRILLEMTYEAIESAGWSRESIAGSETSVHAAMFTTDYDRNLYKDTLDLPVYYITGTEKAILANRISHYFDLHGPSVTLDTGCSGGLVALHQACQSLRDGESNASIVASANLTLNPDHHIGMSNLHLIGGSGRSFPFDERGTGYGRGEGFVVLALKRLEDALRDRDPIQAVIRSTAVNQDGYTPAGITYPNGSAQADLIRSAYERCGLQPKDVSYVEAHGTGTVAGDTEELNALAEVFSSSTRSLPLYVGSIKGSIGHTENTSGLASLVKAALVLDRQEIPPVAGFAHPKPGLPLDRLRIPTEPVPLPIATDITPTVSINSFGFGGTNSHAILQRGPRYYPSCNDMAPRLFILSAHTEESLKSMVQTLVNWLENEPNVSLADLSYTLCHRRTLLVSRWACVAENRVSLLDQLRRRLGKGSFRTDRAEPYIVFVFTGQGAQWACMGRELLTGSSKSSVFRDSLERSQGILSRLGAPWDLEQELLRDPAQSLLHTAQLAQPITTVIQLALVDLLRAQGARPRIVLGHSSGEIAAAYAAGRISHDAAIHIAFHRGSVAALYKSRDLPLGAMMSVGLSESDISPFMHHLSRGRASIACVNSPTNVTISGDAEAIDEVATRLEEKDTGIFHRRLNVDTAYHSHHMESVADAYLDRLRPLETEQDTEPNDNGVIFMSSVTGEVKTRDFGPGYWTSNLVSKVRFCDAVQSLARYRDVDGSRRDIFFVEIGPHPALAGPVRQSMAASGNSRIEFDYQPTLERKKGAASTILGLMACLFERGAKLDVKSISSLAPGLQTANVLTNMPSYTWDHRTKHWHESRVSHQYRTRRNPYHDLLGVRSAESTSIQPRWRHMICLATLPWLAHHVVDSLVIFPGSGYLCMASEAMRQLSSEQFPLKHLEMLAFHDISFLRALIIPELPRRVEVQLSLDPQPNLEYGFSFRISAFTDGHWNEYCSGLVEAVLMDDKSLTRLLPVESFLAEQPKFPGEAIDREKLYEDLAEVGNVYGSSFNGIRSFTAAPDASQALSTVEIPDVAPLMPEGHQAPHLIHPSTLDILLHTALPLVGRRLGRGSVMPTHIDELLLSATDAMPRGPGSIFKALTTLNSSVNRTSHADIFVESELTPVLAASGIEMRSLGDEKSVGGDSTVTEGICYELDWIPDVDFVNKAASPSPAKLEDVIGHYCLKNTSMSVLALGAGSGELSLSFVTAANAHRCNLAAFDFADADTEHSLEIQEMLRARYVPSRVRNMGDVTAETVSELHTYDVLLVANDTSLKRASTFLKPGGRLFYRIGFLGTEKHIWSTALQEAPSPLEVELICRDHDGFTTIVATQPKNYHVKECPKKLCMLSKSDEQPMSSWARSLESRLRGLSPGFASTTIDGVAVNAENETETCFLVIDDQTEPLVSDPYYFGAVAELLKKPAQILWVSPAEPLSFHQIVGVARTAHAENERLRLTTIHADIEMLESQQLSNLIVECLKRPAVQNESIREREYWMRKDGSVLIPRLLPNNQLNLAVNSQHGQFGIEDCYFANSDYPLVLSADRKTGDGLFVRDDMFSTLLAADMVQIETEAFTISEAHVSGVVCEYVGTISHVGTSVKRLSPGDRVMAIGSIAAANRIRIHQDLASILPIDLPLQTTGMLLHTMGSSYIIDRLVQLSPGGTVLIHGALTLCGRAVAAAAKDSGARVVVTAVDQGEARELMETLDIALDDILVCRRSSLRSSRDTFSGQFDAIILAAETTFPSKALAHLKPFGSVVALVPSGRLPIELQHKLPSNTSTHRFDTVGLLKSRPELIPGLLSRAAMIVKHLALSGITIYTRDVSQIAEVLKRMQGSLREATVFTVHKRSKVRALIPQDESSDQWTNDHVSYVVAGGLGDLGRRLLDLMAQRGGRHLVTLSRKAPKEIDRTALQARLEAIQPGCRLYCLQCDLTSERSVQQAASTLRDMGVPPVRGVINSAAILQDRPLSTMTYGDFSLASGVKVQGTLALERAFKTASLEFFIMLSSAVNIVGASGQANYNAGNAVQDALAQARQKDSCCYISLNIGWIEDAVHTAENNARLGGLGRSGLRAIKHDELLRFLDYALGCSKARHPLPQAIIGFDAESLSKALSHNGNIQSPMFSHIRRNSEVTSPGGEASAPTSKYGSFKEVVASGNGGLVLDFISAAICDRLVKLISVDVSRIDDRHSSLLELGMDSLIAIELRNWLMREFDAPLQSSEIMDDQTIRALGAKVALRSRIALAHRDGANQDVEEHVETRQNSAIIESGTTATSPNGCCRNGDLPLLPVPSLEDTLRKFQASRHALDSPEEQDTTDKAVRAFLEEYGPFLRQELEGLGPAAIANNWEEQVHLGRREPLQDHSEFSVGHPIDAPAQTQSLRAAVLTVAAAQYAYEVISGEVSPDSYQGQRGTGEAHSWLFWSTRLPGPEVDRMERHHPSPSVIILRRGHIFQLTLAGKDTRLELSAVHAAFEQIIGLSNTPLPDVLQTSILSKSPANNDIFTPQAREELANNPENASILAAIDSAMFVVCLDDESPTTSGERHTQFLLGNPQHPFTNRWLDKPVQFVVAANGLSAGVYEHTKLDLLDVRALHQRVIQELFVRHDMEPVTPSSICPLREHIWRPSPVMLKRVQDLKYELKLYPHIDHQYVTFETLGTQSLRALRASPHATAHLVALLAVYFVDGKIRPAWEVVSQGNFLHGRIDWVQTIFPSVRSFLEEAAAAIADDKSGMVSQDKVRHLQPLLDAASKSHARAVSDTARGLGFVNHLYALRGALESLPTVTEKDDVHSPELFRTRAWNATRRGGAEQDLKIGFMPVEESDHPDAWDEGGFLMHGDRGIYIHSSVHDHYMKFAVSARPEAALQLY